MTTLPSGQNLLMFTGNEVQSSDGTPIVPTTDPLLSRTGFTISQQGPDDLIVAKSDANVTLPGPLLKLTDTSVQAGDAFLSVAGRVTSTSPQPFIDLDSDHRDGAGQPRGGHRAQRRLWGSPARW